MAIEQTYENFAVPEGGVILWSEDFDAAPDNDVFLVKIASHPTASDPVSFAVAMAEKNSDGTVCGPFGNGTPVAWVRCPDPESQVAYQLGDPGEGTGSTRGPGEGN